MTEIPSRIRIGTRGSPLAMAQTNTVCGLLTREFPDLETDIVVIKTSGDWKPSDGEVRLSEAAGGKGQFAKEIEEALLTGEIDAAVHSMKDMDSHLPEGLAIDHMLSREDACDALLFRDRSWDDIPENAVVGTASVRRGAFLQGARKDLNIVPFRGNVQTRINKLRGAGAQGEVVCTLLAMAGLKRLGLENEADVVLSPDQMLPAAGQGAVGIETRIGDADIIQFFDAISCSETLLCVSAERAALAALDGSCHTPIGAYAVLEDGEMYLRVKVISCDGSQSFSDKDRVPVKTREDAITLGRRIGEALYKIVPDGILT